MPSTAKGGAGEFCGGGTGMDWMERLLLRTFGRPQGALGRLGGRVMARTNSAFAHTFIDALEVGPDAKVLEVGFGPGMAIEHLAGMASPVWVAGVDCSIEMIEQASARNAAAIDSGLVDLRQGVAQHLPFRDEIFDLAFAINSMQVWPDVRGGLREILRVLKPGGRIALGFTPHSRQADEGAMQAVEAAGFAGPRLLQLEGGFGVIAERPGPA